MLQDTTNLDAVTEALSRSVDYRVCGLLWRPWLGQRPSHCRAIVPAQ
jgi:hypothetical protein